MADELMRELSRVPGWYEVSLVVWSRAGFTCEYCGRDLLASVDDYRWGWHHDHLIAKSISHDHSFENLVLACGACNRYKGVYDPRSDAGADATRDALIEAVRRYVKQRREQDAPLLQQVRDLVARFG